MKCTRVTQNLVGEVSLDIFAADISQLVPPTIY